MPSQTASPPPALDLTPSRRDVLRWLGGATVLGLAGCSADLAAAPPEGSEADAAAPDAVASDLSSAPDAATSDLSGPPDADAPDVPGPPDATPVEGWASGGTAAMTAKGAYPDPHAASPTGCAHLMPTTPGPCTTARQLDREDLSEGRPGLPVRLSLRVVDDACAPRAGVTVRVWHTTREGSYTGQTPNNRFCVLDAALAASDAGRGFRVTDSLGVAAFDTCFPGWYPGRAIHLHLELLDGDRSLGVSQLFFPEDVTAAIFATHPDYAPFGQPDTRASTDGVIRAIPEADRPRHLLEVARMPDGAMLASKTLVA